MSYDNERGPHGDEYVQPAPGSLHLRKPMMKTRGGRDFRVDGLEKGRQSPSSFSASREVRWRVRVECKQRKPLPVQSAWSLPSLGGRWR